jgi:hypothetical protein
MMDEIKRLEQENRYNRKKLELEWGSSTDYYKRRSMPYPYESSQYQSNPHFVTTKYD